MTTSFSSWLNFGTSLENQAGQQNTSSEATHNMGIQATNIDMVIAKTSRRKGRSPWALYRTLEIAMRQMASQISEIVHAKRFDSTPMSVDMDIDYQSDHMDIDMDMDVNVDLDTEMYSAEDIQHTEDPDTEMTPSVHIWLYAPS